MKVAEIYSITGEHTITIGGNFTMKMSEDEGGVVDATGEILLKASALVLTGRLEVTLDSMGVTHCVDLKDPENGAQEAPIPIAEFFNRWRMHIATEYPDD